MQSLPICFHYLKAPWFWLDNYNVLSQPAVTKEQELPKWSKMHRRLLLIYHTVMNPDTAFWSMELKDRKRERKKKKEEEKEKGRPLNILFQSVSMNEENTRHDSIKGCPPTVMLLLEKWPLCRYPRHTFPKAHRPSLCWNMNFHWW